MKKVEVGSEPFGTRVDTHTHTLEERKHPSAKYANVKVCKCSDEYASMSMQACNDYTSTQ